MPFQQATQAQDADPLGNALDAGQAYELPVQRGLEQGFWHGRLGQANHCRTKWVRSMVSSSNGARPVLARGA